MAEYIEEGLNFEALMIFLPDRILKSFLNFSGEFKSRSLESFIVFPANELMQDFKVQFRHYFDHRLFDYKRLIPLKQQEILTLLLASGYKQQIGAFIQSAISRDINDMKTVIEEHILQPVTVSELAKLCNRSLAAFKRDFKKQYDTSPRIFINKQRLKHALMLLQNTNRPVS